MDEELLQTISRALTHLVFSSMFGSDWDKAEMLEKEDF